MMLRSAAARVSASRLGLQRANAAVSGPSGWARLAFTEPLKPAGLVRSKVTASGQAEKAKAAKSAEESSQGASGPQYGLAVTWGLPTFVALLAIVGWNSFNDSKSASVSSSAVPQLEDHTSEATISVSSDVQVLDLKAADAKLRQDAQSLSFSAKGKEPGRVHTFRLSSNIPVEDEYAVAQGKGMNEHPTLFAGVYDGHAWVSIDSTVG